MQRELSSHLPIAVLSAIENALVRGERACANQAAHLAARAAHLELAREERERDDAVLHTMATDVFEWGMALRDALPLGRLYDIFQVPDDASGPYISLILEEIALDAAGRTPGGTLTTELFVGLCPNASWPFRRVERFDGDLMHAPADTRIDSSAELQSKLHPQMLRAIHARIADGDVWERIAQSISTLKTWFQDS